MRAAVLMACLLEGVLHVETLEVGNMGGLRLSRRFGSANKSKSTAAGNATNATANSTPAATAAPAQPVAAPEQAPAQTKPPAGAPPAGKAGQTLSEVHQTEEQELDQALAEADADKDGRLSWSEFLTSAKASHQKEQDEARRRGKKVSPWTEQGEKDLKETFMKYDEDSDGFLSRSELLKLVQEQDEDDDDREHEGHRVRDRHRDEHDDHEELDEHDHDEEDDDGHGASLLEVEEEDESGDEGDEERDWADEDRPEDAEPDEDEELEAMSLIEQSEAEGRDQDITTVISQIDTDHDEKLSLPEVQAFMKTDQGKEIFARYGVGVWSIKDVFLLVDANGDGLLDRSELAEFSGEGNDQENEDSLLEDGSAGESEEDDDRLSDEQLLHIFRSVDKDKDGTVNFNDIQQRLAMKSETSMVKDDFEKADLGKDGTLDSKEFLQFTEHIIRRYGEGTSELFPDFLDILETSRE